ncbi:tyrosine-type recombinase/integrase [Actinomadura sp. 3N407]|uniref:tyrosine-type recombinase/integrase n=1 Tax=Actinomadura sp. 3N407 TaxID=3457423 RepID=UPI003FCE97FB
MARVRSAGGVYRRCGCGNPRTGRAVGRDCPRLQAERGHGSWYLRLELGAGLDGRHRRVRRGGYRTRKAAEEALARLRGPTGNAITVAEWLARWLRDHPGAASTVAGYANHVRLYLTPRLGGLLLGELTVQHLREMFAAIVHEHQRDGRPIKQAARVEQWERTGERSAVAVWTAEQAAAFLHAIGGHRLYAAYHLIALRGLRRGEAAGLCWVDVDLEHGTATICQQLQRRNGRLEPCALKTAHSARAIALDRTTIAALRAHRDRQQAEAAAYWDRYRDSGHVFTNLNGDSVSPGRLTHVFQKMLAEHRLPPVRLHDLRHGAATWRRRPGWS